MSQEEQKKERVLRNAEWRWICKLIQEARKDLMAVVNRLHRQGENDIAEHVFDTVVQVQ